MHTYLKLPRKVTIAGQPFLFLVPCSSVLYSLLLHHLHNTHPFLTPQHSVIHALGKVTWRPCDCVNALRHYVILSIIYHLSNYIVYCKLYIGYLFHLVFDRGGGGEGVGEGFNCSHCNTFMNIYRKTSIDLQITLICIHIDRLIVIIITP